MFYSYLVTGSLSVIIAILWYYKVRHINQFEGSDSIDDFSTKDEYNIYDKIEKYDKIQGDILFFLILIYGIVAFYNAIATLSGWSIMIETLYYEF